MIHSAQWHAVSRDNLAVYLGNVSCPMNGKQGHSLSKDSAAARCCQHDGDRTMATHHRLMMLVDRNQNDLHGTHISTFDPNVSIHALSIHTAVSHKTKITEYPARYYKLN